MQLNNIIKEILFKYPLFGNVIVNLEFRHTSENVNAPAFTDGKRIYYKDEFLKNYNDDEKMFIILHEIFHIVLSHLFRNEGKDPDLLNYVEDGIINQLLVHNGLIMPEGLVNIEDALDYSVDELYMKYLPKLKIIKQWMGENTFHMDLSGLSEMLQQMIRSSYSENIVDLLEDNEKLQQDLFEDYKCELESIFNKSKSQIFGKGEEITSAPVGRSSPLLRWQDLFESSIYTPQDSSSYFEIQMDGIIKKETKSIEDVSDSEIVIDSSGSMSINLIKAVLRECKNMLLCSCIKVGFCDQVFYGWNQIKTEDDIDRLKIEGRCGTDFSIMVNSFSKNVDNKIIITDGYGNFPEHCPGILWIIIGDYEHHFINPRVGKQFEFSIDNVKNINYIFVDINEIYRSQIQSKKLLKSNRNH